MDQISAHLDRGWDLAQKGDGPGAVECARRAMEIDPKSPEVHNLLGYGAALAGESEEAVEHYRHALTLDENYFEAMLNCVEVLISPLEEWDEAEAMCVDALEIAETPEEIADCTLLMVDALLGKGAIEEAKLAIRRIPDGPFDNPGYLFLIGRAYYEVGDVTRAAPLIEQAITRDPLHADAFYYSGLIKDEQGDDRGAIEAFLRSRSLDLSRAPAAWLPSPEAFAQIVRKVVSSADALLASRVAQAEVFVVDVPGAEIVVDGVDPRALLILDATETEDARPAARLFVYQRNVERAAGSAERLEDELTRALEREITAVFLNRDRPDEPPPDKSRLN